MDNIIVEQKGRVALIHLNRPDKLNALSTALFTELNAAIDDAEKNDDTGRLSSSALGGRLPSVWMSAKSRSYRITPSTAPN